MYLVLAVIRNDYAHKQCQSDHGSQKNIHVHVDGMSLENEGENDYRICQNKRPPPRWAPIKNSDFQRGEYTKPMALGGWFFKGESTQNRWVLMGFGICFIASKN